ncbi:MAG: hypothetical protein HFE86_06590 [Clostridiales bacterium]|nr:hypothetical protein [Clostridiales bacterium]
MRQKEKNMGDKPASSSASRRAKRPAEWTRLDNAAKIFPPTSNRRETRVFRFACQLREPVNPGLLQTALEQTVELFPMWRTVLRHGLFWYYLEKSERLPLCEEEHRPICGPIYEKSSDRLLFEVSYYGGRINLEVYHALTDGTGALHFLQTLVCLYLRQAHPELPDLLALLDYDASSVQKAEDSFQKYYHGGLHTDPDRVRRAYRLRGASLPEQRLRAIRGLMPVDQALAAAHRYNASLTVFLAAALLLAIHAEIPLRQRKRPVVLTVPVNLRNYFQSQTARNFFGTIEAGGRVYDGEPVLERVIADLEQDFKRELTAEALSRRMSAFTVIEHNFGVRAAPLAMKDLVLGLANWYAKFGTTCSISNVGRVQMPPPAVPYIHSFDVFSSTDKLQVCICSFNGQLSVGFTSHFISTEIEKRFFRTLTREGVEVEITTSWADDG